MFPKIVPARGPIIVVVILILAASSWVRSEGQESKSAEKDLDPGEIIGRFLTGGQIWSSPVLDAGTIYIGSDDGCLWAIEAETLKPKWKAHTGGRVRSTAAVADDAVYFASDDGFLYKVSSTDGAEVWRFELHPAGIERVLPSLYPPYSYDTITSSPMVHEGLVFVGSANGRLFAVDTATGKAKWRYSTGDRIRSTPVVHDGRLYVGSWDHHLYALDPKTGKLLWRFDTGGVVQATPAVGGGRVYIGSRNPKVFAVDAATGEQVWEYPHADGSWVESSGVYRDGVLFIGSSDAQALFAHDASTGKVEWSYHTGGWSWCTPAISDDSVYIGSIGAHPYAAPLERGLHAVDAKTGERRWYLATGKLPGFVTGGVMGTPLVIGSRVIVGALDNQLIAVAD